MVRKFAAILLLCLALAGSAQAGGWHKPKPKPKVPHTVAELLEIVKVQGFSILHAAVQAADPSIAEALSDKHLKATVFFPQDKAFTDFLAKNKLNATDLLGNKELLTDVLKLHVVPQIIRSNHITRHPWTVRTLLKGWAGRISLFRKWKSVLIESKGNGDHYSKVVLADIAVGKSIVHVIDYPLFQGLPKTKA